MWIANAEQRARGFRLRISRRERIAKESIDPRIKNFHWIDLTLGLYEAYEHGDEMVVLIDRHGNLTEGPGINLFMLRNGELLTPSSGVFEGMTRRTMFELAAETNVKVREADIPAEALRGADEVFATSTAGGVMPIAFVDGAQIGDGKPGPLTQRLHDLYWSKKEAGWYGTPVDYGTA